MKVEFWLSTDYVTEPNYCRFGLNGCEYWAGYVPRSTSLSFDVDIVDGPNQLTIEVDNRDESKSTIVDANGNIIRNTFVSIDNIIIDDYMMRELKNDHGSMEVDWDKNKGAYEFLLKTGNPNDHLKNTSYIALNGKYCFDFEAPLDQWLLQVRTVDGYVFEQLMKENDELFTEVVSMIKRSSV